MTNLLDNIVSAQRAERDLLTGGRLNEVDFLTLGRQGNPELLQVCYQMSDGKTRERELAGLVAAAKTIRAKQLTVVTMSERDTVTKDGLVINVRPIQDWLL